MLCLYAFVLWSPLPPSSTPSFLHHSCHYTDGKDMARIALKPLALICHIQRDPWFYSDNIVLHSKTAMTGGSLLLPLPFPIILFSICCSLFSQAIPQHSVFLQVQNVMLFHSKLALLATGSYVLLLKRKMIETHIHRHRCSLVEAPREIK